MHSEIWTEISVYVTPRHVLGIPDWRTRSGLW